LDLSLNNLGEHWTALYNGQLLLLVMNQIFQ